MYSVFPLREASAATSRSEQELLGSSTTSWREAGGRVSSPGAAGTCWGDERAQGRTGAGVGEAWLCESSWGAVAKAPAWGAWQEAPPHQESLICDLGLSVNPCWKAGGKRAVRGLHCALWVICGSLERPPGRQRDGEYWPHQQRPGPGQRDTYRSGGQPGHPTPGGLGLSPLGPVVGLGEGGSPLHRMARLRPRASAVPELMFSTSRCFTFFSTGTR